MKKYKLLVVAVVLGIIGLGAGPVAAHGGSHSGSHFRSGQIASIKDDEVLDASAYLAGTTVTVSGTVRGDLYCAGQNIDVTGTVEGDVICAGQTVNITGTVLGDVRVAGQTVTLAGPIGHSLTAFGQTVTLSGNAVVNMDATVYGTSLQMGGKVGRDMVVGGQSVSLAGTVGRDITATTEQLIVGGGARIAGSVDYTSRNELTKDNGAVISGQATRHDPPSHEQQTSDSWANQFWGVAFWFGAWVVLGLLLLAVAPRSLKVTAELMTKQFGWALLAGIGVLLLTPIVAVLLMMTIVGIPAGVILLLVWVASLLAAYAYSGFALGQWIATQTGWNLRFALLMSLGLGLALLALLMLIPVVGGLFSFVALVWGLGGLVLATHATLRARSDRAKLAAKKTK